MMRPGGKRSPCICCGTSSASTQKISEKNLSLLRSIPDGPLSQENDLDQDELRWCSKCCNIGSRMRSNSPDDKKVRSKKRRVPPDLTLEAAAEVFRKCRERQRNASHPRSLQNRVCSICTLSYSNETGVVAGDAGGAEGDVDLCPVTTKKFKSEKSS